MNEDQVREYALGTLEWWLTGYTPDSPQHHFQSKACTDKWADFLVTPMGPHGLERERAKRFRISVNVEEVRS